MIGIDDIPIVLYPRPASGIPDQADIVMAGAGQE